MDGLAASQTDEAEHFSPKWRKGKRAFALLGAAGLVVVIGAVWAFRLPLAESLLRQQLSAPGAPARLTLTRLDFSGAAARDLQIGAAAAPDFTAKRVNADFAWSWFAPRLTALAADQPRLTIRINETGFSLGALDRYVKGGGGGGARQAQLPDMQIALRDLSVRFETPLGVAEAKGGAQGALRRDFTLTMRIPPTNAAGPRGALANVRGDLSARTAQGRLAGKLTTAATALRWTDGGAISEPRFDAAFDMPVTLTSAQLNAQMRVDGGALAGVAFGEARGEALINADELGGGWPKSWNGQISTQIAGVSGKSVAAQSAAARADFTGEAGKLSANLVATLANGGAFGVRAGSARLEGPFSTDLAHKPLAVTARTTLRAENASVNENLREQIVGAIPALGATPIGPLMGSFRPTLDRALTRFTLNAPILLAWENDQARFSAPGGATLLGANGAHIDVSPLNQTRAAFAVTLPGVDKAGGYEGAALIALSGAAMPQAKISITDLKSDGKSLAIDGDLAIAGWRTKDAAATSKSIAFSLRSDANGGRAQTNGAATLTGPFAGMQWTGAETPLNFNVVWNKGFTFATPATGCAPIKMARLDFAGLAFDNAALALCPQEAGALAIGDEKGVLRGGFSIPTTTLAGRVAGPGPVRPARLTLGGISGALGGTMDSLALDATITAPVLTVNWDKERRIDLKGRAATANLRTSAKGWGVTGALNDFWITDNTAPARLENLNANWRADPMGDGAVLRLSNGAGRVFDFHEKTIVSPMRLTAITALLQDGVASANGAISLEKTKAPIGRFTLNYNIPKGEGRAEAVARDLTFSPALQPYDLSEAFLGVVDNVVGPIDGEITMSWNPDRFITGARVDLKNLNLATAALGPTQGVSGVITFSDFATLTTLPGQVIKAAQINPGIPVRDGVARFQMLPGLNIKIEDARFPFSGGVLSVEPTTIAMTGKETRLTLNLTSVDVARLTQDLNVKGLTATGEVAGRFPLVFADGKGRIEHGTLTAQAPGGTIQYDGGFDQATGPAKLAFGALRSFRYDALTLDLDGALDGELVTQIAFAGVNREPVQQSAGPAGINLVGIPFKFNVTVKAPFMTLARTAAGFSDARGLVNQVEPNINITAEPQTAPIPAPAPKAP